MKFAAAIALMLFVIQTAIPATSFLLPLGGTIASQIAIVFAGAYSLYGIVEGFRAREPKK